MKTLHSKPDADLVTLMQKAADFHGHLGPFLTLGVRIGLIGLKKTDEQKNHGQLYVTTTLNPSIPFSCVIDGIQVSTKCTIGNGKLEIKESKGRISVHFKRQDSNQTLKIQVKDEMIEDLMETLSKGASNEELAWRIVSMPERRLFIIKRHKLQIQKILQKA